MKNNQSGSTGSGRIAGLDAARGIAVLFMMQQHIGAWLWSEPWISLSRIFREHPVMMSFNWLGHLAAPLFVTLAGAGTVFLRQRHGSSDTLLIKRGAVTLLAGCLLNLLSPHWFSPLSWYVLHLIGFSLALSPLLARTPSAILLPFSAALFVLAAVMQTILNTPLLLDDAFMNSADRTGGVARLMFTEGHFPVLPWLALFINGIVAGRCIAAKKTRALLVMAACSAGAGLLLAALYRQGHAFATYGPCYRLFVILPYFYPPLPACMLLLSGAALAIIAGLHRIDQTRHFASSNAIVCLGRSSLTLLLLHIVVFNELSRPLGIYKAFSLPATACLLLSVLALFTFLSAWWQRYDFRYGAEWAMRKLTGQ